MKIFIPFFLLAIVTILPSYETSMLNMDVPTNLEYKTMEVNIRHRFMGAIDDELIDNFFGMDIGANINLGVRFPIYSKLELELDYIRVNSEYNLALSYKLPTISIFKSQIEFEYFSFEKLGQTERRNNFLYQIDLQSKELFSRVTPALNLGFDGYHERFILALGMNVKFTDSWGMIAEYFPVIDRNNDASGRTSVGENSCFAIGLRLQTYAHHFMLILSNNDKIGIRNMGLGSPTDDLKFGFNLSRKLYL